MTLILDRKRRGAKTLAFNGLAVPFGIGGGV